MFCVKLTVVELNVFFRCDLDTMPGIPIKVKVKGQLTHIVNVRYLLGEEQKAAAEICTQEISPSRSRAKHAIILVPQRP